MAFTEEHMGMGEMMATSTASIIEEALAYDFTAHLDYSDMPRMLKSALDGETSELFNVVMAMKRAIKISLRAGASMSDMHSASTETIVDLVVKEIKEGIRARNERDGE